MNDGVAENKITAMPFGHVRKRNQNKTVDDVSDGALQHRTTTPLMKNCVRNITTNKRARGSLEEWKEFIIPENKQQPWSLKDLFGSEQRRQEQTTKSVSAMTKNRDDEFYTFRLDHRQSGAMAKYIGEERILLFRNDRPGAIGKIIFSSTPPAPTHIVGVDCESAERNSARTKAEEDRMNMAQAKIHVLDVKEPYRGYGLGNLLCTEAVTRLRHRHDNQQQQGESFICCQLEAEEDCRRHNKLVCFYQDMGFHAKPRAKVQYINNNDGETYRKVTMQRTIRVRARRNCKDCEPLTLPSWYRSFLPIQIKGPNGEAAYLNSCSRMYLVDAGDGTFELRTTHRVCGNDQDLASTLSSDNCDAWSRFRLVQFTSTKKLLALNPPFFDHNHAREARSLLGSLWLLQSSQGSFLSVDEYHANLFCTKRLSFWQTEMVEGNCVLKCTADTPLRRHYYSLKCATQSVDYVRSMRKNYLCFDICSMTLKEALDKARFIDAGMVEFATEYASPSLCSFCFHTAEWFRRQGEPDWVQFLGLVYSLGRVVKLIEPRVPSHSEDSAHDWTISTQDWVLGCDSQPSYVSSELSWADQDNKPETAKEIYGTSCGLDNVLMTWSSQEYIAELFRHNKVDLPEEALAMLRLASLRSWHSAGKYKHLSNDKDEDLIPFVADFDEALEQAQFDAMERPTLEDKDCDRLWFHYYLAIAEKYGADGTLRW